MERPRIPILASTANASVDVVNACFAAGMDDCLVKPLTLQRLREALSPWLQAAASDQHRLGEAGQAGAHVHAHDPADLPIDASVLADLTGGDADIRAQLFASLRESTRQDAEAIEHAAALEDMSTLATRAHRMLGACMVVGARALAEVCRELLQSGQSGDQAAMHAALPRFHEERARLNDFLDRMEAEQA
jgi:HPt (histidine-containing phosphotransfer) domain-containing protein